MANRWAATARARAAAYREAAEHLLLHWTDDPDEISQSKIVSNELQMAADRYDASAVSAGETHGP